ncbi:hypothetical protein K2X89_12275, partial [Myxococcota bacterium]|nr:hypothetical protein [Myxococcota bacterium]
LYWVRWTEQLGDPVSPAQVDAHDEFVVVGPILCEDIDIGEAPAGSVAACVPHPNHATAQFVPDPARACGVRSEPSIEARVSHYLNDWASEIGQT